MSEQAHAGGMTPHRIFEIVGIATFATLEVWLVVRLAQAASSQAAALTLLVAFTPHTSAPQPASPPARTPTAAALAPVSDGIRRLPAPKTQEVGHEVQIEQVMPRDIRRGRSDQATRLNNAHKKIRRTTPTSRSPSPATRRTIPIQFLGLMR